MKKFEETKSEIAGWLIDEINKRAGAKSDYNDFVALIIEHFNGKPVKPFSSKPENNFPIDAEMVRVSEWFIRTLIRTEGRILNAPGLAKLMVDRYSTSLKDFHGHSDYSDGQESFEEYGNKATALGVTEIAITDHDTIKGQIELADGNESLGDFEGDFLNGVEITSRLGERRVETLVYGYDIEKARKYIDNFDFPFLNRKFKIKRNIYNILKRIDTVNKLGLTEEKLSLNDFLGVDFKKANGEIETKTFEELGLNASKYWNFDSEETVMSNKDFPQSVRYRGRDYPINFNNFNSKLFKKIISSEKGKAYLATYKNSKGEPVATFPDFNRNMLQVEGNPFSVDDSKFWPTVEQCVAFARKTGGVSLLAHSFGYGPEQGKGEDIAMAAVNAGVDGLEVWHGFNTVEEVMWLYKLCYQNGLCFDIGSDNHGYNKTREGRNNRIGYAPGKGEDIFETGLTPKTVHDIGTGEYTKHKNRKPKKVLKGSEPAQFGA